MSDTNDQMEIPQIWIKQMMALPEICNQIFCTVLDALHMSNPERKNVCITFAREASHDYMKIVTGEITVAGSIDHETVVRRVMKDIGFESLVVSTTMD